MAPAAQNELVITFRAVTLFDSRFQSAPQAEWPLICKGSSDARSKNRASVGETTMDSSATMPDVWFLRLKRHPGSEETVPTRGTMDKMRERVGNFITWLCVLIDVGGKEKAAGSLFWAGEHHQPYMRPVTATPTTANVMHTWVAVLEASPTRICSVHPKVLRWACFNAQSPKRTGVSRCQKY